MRVMRVPQCTRGVCVLAAWCMVGLAWCGVAFAQDAQSTPPSASIPAPDSASASAPVSPELLPPQPLDATQIPYPDHVPSHTQPITVRVVIRVDDTGAVDRVELLTAGNPILEQATLWGATHFRFKPGTYAGAPVPVEIAFEQVFAPSQDGATEAQPVTPDGQATHSSSQDTPAPTAILAGRLVERGTRRPVVNATIVAMRGDQEWSTRSDAQGQFRLPVVSGGLDIRVVAPDYQLFRQHEDLQPSQELLVQYRVDRVSYSTYETVVMGQKSRTEIARTTLRGREIRHIPGSFGDPFRVIMALPGTTQLMSLLPMPVVRGSSPGNTGFLLDGVRMPLLFHLLAGPSVIHPEFIDQIDFYPGGFPVEYGGYTAGIVDGKTRAARPDEKRYEFGADLTSLGGFVRSPVSKWGNITATVAGRYGYPSLLLKLANADARLNYWDYQARVEGHTGAHHWTIFALGGSDDLQRRVTIAPEAPAQSSDPSTEPSTQRQVFQKVAQFQFHRIDVRYQRNVSASDDFIQRMGPVEDRYQVVLGFDQSQLGNDAPSTRAWNVTSRFSWQRPLMARLKLEGGLQAYVQNSNSSTRSNLGSGTDGGVTSIEDKTHLPQIPATPQSDNLYSVGVWLGSPWRPIDDLIIVPGIRTDVYISGNTTKVSADPRISLRYRVYRQPETSSEPHADANVHSKANSNANAISITQSKTPLAALTSLVPKGWFGDVWLKGGVGWYHQPPRLFVPMPGFSVSSLDQGLLGAVQSSLGIESPIPWGLKVDLQGYFNYMDPLFFEPAFNKPFDNSAQAGPVDPASANLGNVAAGNVGGNVVSDLLARHVGRSFGAELMVRKQDDGRFFGWVAYTLSRSERRREGHWVPFDFDRMHILNVVGGIRLPRNWEVGGRMQVQSGTPLSTITGFNDGRTPVFVRFDIRIDKRAVWNNWLLDFYVDVINLGLSKETGGLLGGNGFRYVLPTIGVRAIL